MCGYQVTCVAQEAGDRTVQETTILRQVIQGKEPKIQSPRVRTFRLRPRPDDDSVAGTRTYTTVLADELDISFEASPPSSKSSTIKPLQNLPGEKEVLVLNESDLVEERDSVVERYSEVLHNAQQHQSTKDGKLPTNADRAEAQPPERSGSLNRRRLGLLMGCVLVTLAILGVVVGLVTRSGAISTCVQLQHIP